MDEINAWSIPEIRKVPKKKTVEKCVNIKAALHMTGTLLVSLLMSILIGRHAVAQWLRHCATNRKVVESISDGVIGIFH
jgi:hypothetical protein